MAKLLPPKISYQEAFTFVETLVDKLGTSPTEITTAAKTLNFANRNSGTFPIKIGAAKQFGLLDYPKDAFVQVSQLYKNIKIGDDVENFIKEALTSPNFYKELIDRYTTNITQSPQVISTFIENSYGVKKKDADKIAKAFIESMKVYPTNSNKAEVDFLVERTENDELYTNDVNQEKAQKSKTAAVDKERQNLSLEFSGIQLSISAKNGTSRDDIEIVEAMIHSFFSKIDDSLHDGKSEEVNE